jgi:hypothetical protein
MMPFRRWRLKVARDVTAVCLRGGILLIVLLITVIRTREGSLAAESEYSRRPATRGLAAPAPGARPGETKPDDEPVARRAPK